MIKQQTDQLSSETQRLRIGAMKQKCTGCFLMRKYSSNKYQQLTNRVGLLEQLGTSNSKVNIASEIQRVKQSLALVGLYMNV